MNKGAETRDQTRPEQSDHTVLNNKTQRLKRETKRPKKTQKTPIFKNFL